MTDQAIPYLLNFASRPKPTYPLAQKVVDSRYTVYWASNAGRNGCL